MSTLNRIRNALNEGVKSSAAAVTHKAEYHRNMDEHEDFWTYEATVNKKNQPASATQAQQTRAEMHLQSAKVAAAQHFKLTGKAIVDWSSRAALHNPLHVKSSLGESSSHWYRPTEKPKKSIDAYWAGYKHGARHRDHNVWNLHARNEISGHNPYHPEKEKKNHKNWSKGYIDSEEEKMVGESTDEHRSLGYETARRIHGGMGGMNYTDTMAAVKKVKLRTNDPNELAAFHAGAEHYCSKNCHKESVNEVTVSHKEMADHYDNEVQRLRGMSATAAAKRFPGASTQNAIRAHNAQLKQLKAKAAHHRYVADHPEEFAKTEGFLGFGKKKKVEPVKKDSWPDISKNPKAWSRAQHQDRENQSLAAHNRWKQKKPDGSSIHEGEINHEREYFFRSERAIHNYNVGRNMIGAIHQSTAEGHAKKHFQKTGKKIVDPLYTGSSKYISQLSSESTIPKGKTIKRLQVHYFTGVDDINLHKGIHTFRRGFFYRHGSTSDGFADNVAKQLDSAGVKHTIVDHGTKDYVPFKGGAATKFQNHHWVQVKVHGPIKMEESTKVKNARIQAWHWMGAKKAMGAKYGFDHNVAVNQIPTSMEHNGKTVNPRRAVIWVAQQFANKDKAKKSVSESTDTVRPTPVHSLAGNVIGGVYSREPHETDPEYGHSAYYHGLGNKKTFLGIHKSAEMAASTIQNHHEFQKKAYQKAADLHRKDYEHHQKIRDSMVESKVRKPDESNPEAMYHYHMGKHYELWDKADATAHPEGAERIYDKSVAHAEKAERFAAIHFKKTGKKIKDSGYTGNSPHIEDSED